MKQISAAEEDVDTCLDDLGLNWNRKTYYYWSYIRFCACLILDGFLIPQILLNVLRDSAEEALTSPFYVGMSAVRLVPHAYNQYIPMLKIEMNSTYCYANPAAEMYSTGWDIVIPCVIIALAVIVYVQQWHGGRCILPKKIEGFGDVRKSYHS